MAVMPWGNENVFTGGIEVPFLNSIPMANSCELYCTVLEYENQFISTKWKVVAKVAREKIVP
tara:strand:+ start:65 stop:250 length:186 start_codon:yes stop_codon:yes gene_type:complete